MPVITLANGKRFDAQPGQTVLQAARSAGLLLEHSCEIGRCGSCRARRLRGEVVALRDADALSAQEQAAGWILTCTHEARSDLDLATADLDTPVVGAKTYPARIDRLQRLAPDVLRVVLRLPPGADFSFLAGQHVELSGPKGVRRSYSIASDPASAQRLELQLRRVNGGRFSSYWFEHARPNDLLRLRGPLGTFFLRPWSGLHLVFLATGTGMAPVQSMLAQLAAAPVPPRSATLYWGGRTPPDLYVDPTHAFGSRIAGLRVVPVLSRADPSWPGARGHVQDVLLAERATLHDTVVYACGSARMVEDARARLGVAGPANGRFHFDAFVSSE